MDPAPRTLQEVAESLVERSRVIPLDYQVGQNLDLVAPGGTTVETHRPGLILYGPLSWSVLASLWSVGYPARSEEHEALLNAVREVMRTPPMQAPGGETTINIRRALTLWRVLAALSQMLEEIAAFATALHEWQVAGYPRGVRCQIGERFLKWDTGRDGGIVAALTTWTDRDQVRRLLSYPDEQEASLLLKTEDAVVIERLASTSAELATNGFRALATATNPALRRTFVRYKHRITATSPGSAPVWLPHQTAEDWAATDARFDSGFGILDWSARAADPELVLWSAEDEDLFGYSLLMTRAFELFGLLIASVVRFATNVGDVPALPLLLPPDSDLTPVEGAALAALENSDYRVLAMARRHANDHAAT
jgi:hypothetical protein